MTGAVRIGVDFGGTKIEAAPTKCRNCGAELKGAKFCPECGTKMQVAAFCKECGAKLQPGVKFCPECGHKV